MSPSQLRSLGVSAAYATNLVHAGPATAKRGPAAFLESRTCTVLEAVATSTQSLGSLLSLWLLLTHVSS